MKIVEKLWFTNEQGTIGIIIIEENFTQDRKAYIGIGKGKDEQKDAEAILAWGNKFSLDTADWIRQRLTKAGEPSLWLEIEGKVSNRTRNAVARAYCLRRLREPVEKLTDRELLSFNFLGPLSLAEIRAVIPAPE